MSRLIWIYAVCKKSIINACGSERVKNEIFKVNKWTQELIESDPSSSQQQRETKTNTIKPPQKEQMTSLQKGGNSITQTCRNISLTYIIVKIKTFVSETLHNN